MSDRYITLLGAEQVQSAASTMSSTAEEMKRAASSMDYTFDAQRRFLDDWLLRFQAVVESLPPSGPTS